MKLRGMEMVIPGGLQRHRCYQMSQQRRLIFLINNKGDSYLVGCAVTGYSEGTSDDPKFSLKALFQYKIFPEIAELV